MANQDQGQEQGRNPGKSGTANRGFASMSPGDQRAIARMGGAAVSGNREHMAAIGRKGGEASAESRARTSQASGNTKTSRKDTTGNAASSQTGLGGSPDA